jgi:poly(3-hydroxybutyrate) depolymerase
VARRVALVVLVLAVILVGCRRKALPRAADMTAFARPDPSTLVTRPSPGCARTKRSIASGTELRTPAGPSWAARPFLVFPPKSWDGRRPLPVVFAFHGFHTSGRAFESWVHFEDYVEDAAIVVYPEAQGMVWRLGGGELLYVDDMIATLENELCVDEAHLYAFGFSYGGKLVHELGCTRSGPLRAIAVADASWPDKHVTTCGRPIPVLITHRRDDDDEKIAWGRAAEERWQGINRCAADADVVDAAHGCTTHRGCTAPGETTFCEDTFFDRRWKHDWNHTVREEYRALTWAWFASRA